MTYSTQQLKKGRFLINLGFDDLVELEKGFLQTVKPVKWSENKEAIGKDDTHVSYLGRVYKIVSKQAPQTDSGKAYIPPSSPSYMLNPYTSLIAIYQQFNAEDIEIVIDSGQVWVWNSHVNRESFLQYAYGTDEYAKVGQIPNENVRVFFAGLLHHLYNGELNEHLLMERGE